MNLSHFIFDNLDTTHFLSTFLKKNSVDKPYKLNLKDDSIDYVHSFFKSIENILKYSDEEVHLQVCLKTRLSNSVNENSIIIYLDDNEDMCSFTAKITSEQYMYKEYENIEDVVICPIKKKICTVVPNNYLHGYAYCNELRDNTIEILKNNNKNLFCEIMILSNPNEALALSDYTQNHEDNRKYIEYTSIAPFEYHVKCYDDLPYLINNLLYKHAIVDGLDLSYSCPCKVGDYEGREQKSKLAKCLLDINLQCYQGTKYIHIGYLINFYPITDCEWIVKNYIKTPNKNFIVSNIFFYIEKLLEDVKLFYGLPKLLNLKNINIDIKRPANFPGFFEKINEHLFYIVMKITNNSNCAFKTLDGISYYLNQGSILFFPKNIHFEYEDKQCLDTFVLASVY